MTVFAFTRSKHVRYLRIEGRILPDELMKDYVRLFPDRPFLPRVQSISMRTSFVPWLRFLLRSSTPAENQPSAPASTLKQLYIYSTLEAHDVSREEGEGFAHDFVAFQHSNVKLGGDLDVSIKLNPYTLREFDIMFLLGFSVLRDTIEDPFVLPTGLASAWIPPLRSISFPCRSSRSLRESRENARIGAPKNGDLG